MNGIFQTILQCNLSKPHPNGTKYFVRFRQDPDYSNSPFREKFLYCSCFNNTVCLLLDGLAYILHFISVVICKCMFLDVLSDKEVLFNNQSLKHNALLMFLYIK